MTSNDILALTKEWRVRLIELPRRPKRVLLVLNDFLLMTLALWLAFSLRLSTFYVPPDGKFLVLGLLGPAIGIATFFRFGLYRFVTRYIGQKGTVRILLANGLAVVLWALVIFMSGVIGMPRSVVILYGVFASLLVWASRQFVGWILKGTPHARPARFEDSRRRVVIYGAGPTGVALLDALRRSRDSVPIGFVDETQSLWGQDVSGLKVYRPDKLDKLISRDGVNEVLLAMPQLRRRERREIIRRLEPFPVHVKTLPGMEDIASGRVSVSDLRPVDVQDLLGRDPVPPDAELLARSIAGKVVMVTGAGGSIGSELVRQILKQAPRKLVLLELTEAALYGIELEATELLKARADGGSQSPQIVTSLGSVQDGEFLRTVIQVHGVQTIYHAAAYKHVPIVEVNPVAGLKNNTFGTLALVEAASSHDVERVVLISTDKAVRPTNIMGASKRLAELVLQAHAAEAASATVFTAVRFGNVLDSSGSVVKRFRKQIEEGGPVTVTHRDVIRYFMSIPEAAELVIQAGAMATGGDVFVLDMGEPVKIDDLARSMIRLMGMEVLDGDNPDGDITISYVGLRPGEKLYEELLLGDNITTTEHLRIMRSDEPSLGMQELNDELQALRTAMAGDDVAAVHVVLTRTVEGYKPETRHLAGAAEQASHWPTTPRTLH